MFSMMVEFLLVMPGNLSAFLYANKEELYAKLSLE